MTDLPGDPDSSGDNSLLRPGSPEEIAPRWVKVFGIVGRCTATDCGFTALDFSNCLDSIDASTTSDSSRALFFNVVD